MIRKLFTLVICCLLVASCTKGGGSSDDDNNSGSGSGGSTEGAAGERNFTTECGTVIGENLRNPANEREGVDVTITSIASHNVVIVSRDGGQQLVRLRGMRNDIPDFQKTRALNLARQFLGSAILFTDGCATTVSGGGEGVVGELFRASDGTSLSEFLILNNAGDGDATGSCGENLVGVCLAALAEEVQPETGATVSNFLWKPQSDKDGNLVVLFHRIIISAICPPQGNHHFSRVAHHIPDATHRSA